ncbi:hypothetical protein [Acaryochloris marina]|uniref:hypothetical protein n=1 Tax=Acaryochloris marina TaxID=155978 RepID=UPI0021C4469B|nr:hypothetical protein [Acaryochloris marina]BDM83549.1 hypothetical protein AM10699_64100 [Acaryochloris marina MBIC10699]
MKFLQFFQGLKTNGPNRIAENCHMTDAGNTSRKESHPTLQSECIHNDTSAKNCSKTKARLWIRVCLSLFVLVPSIFVILDGSYQNDTDKWAFGTVGTILGYWLKE